MLEELSHQHKGKISKYKITNVNKILQRRDTIKWYGQQEATIHQKKNATRQGYTMQGKLFVVKDC